MKRTIGAGLLFVALAFVSAPRPASGQAAPPRETANKIIAGWPASSRRAAEALLEEYGDPNQIAVNRLEWDERGVFKRVAVRAFPLPIAANGVVENTVRGNPPGWAGVLVFKSAVVVPDSTTGEISAFSGGEETNILALNRENRVLTGRESVAQARRGYGRTLELRAAGKSSPETQRILFSVTKGP